LDQSVDADEIVVVDDGDHDDLSAIVSNYPAVRLIRQENRGLAGARNAGLRAARSDKIVFLDADDRLLPDAIRQGLECFADNPGAAFVYGAHEEVTGSGRKRCFIRVQSRADLIRFNCVGMIASAMFDRTILVERGGFDESLGMCEDWEVFLRLARELPFAAHDQLVASYVKHDANMSRDIRRLKHWIAIVRDRERQAGLTGDDERAWREGAALWDASYPENTPGQLARRLVRKIGRSVRQRRQGVSEPASRV
jgi:glycosyltransferase involved in cell wall biosynthesis